MLRNIQSLSRVQRIVVFVLIFGGGLFALLAVTFLLVRNSIFNSPRNEGVSLVVGITVKPFATLPGDDAYPAAVAVALDGTVYTGSYKTGALWKIDATGNSVEVPGSNDAIGAVSGLTVGSDGTLYIVDQNDADPNTNGGTIKRLTTDGSISEVVAQPDEQGFTTPDDIALDASGNIYVSDRGRDVVWRFAPDGSAASEWWKPPTLDGVTTYEPTGLAYNPVSQSIIVTDGPNNTVYSVAVADASSTLLYRHGERPNPPFFDGVTVTPAGVIYVSALDQNGVAQLDGDNLSYVAGLFRIPSDVDYSVTANKLYVTNFDSSSLVVAGSTPRLPFTIDEVDLNPPSG